MKPSRRAGNQPTTRRPSPPDSDEIVGFACRIVRLYKEWEGVVSTKWVTENDLTMRE